MNSGSLGHDVDVENGMRSRGISVHDRFRDSFAAKPLLHDFKGLLQARNEYEAQSLDVDPAEKQ